MKEKATGLTAVGTAILSSTCCILPIIAATFGLGIGGTAIYLEQFRPYLLGGTALMLGYSFYLVYFKKSKAECVDGTCPTEGSSRLSKIILWSAAGLVLVFGLFPEYSQYIL